MLKNTSTRNLTCRHNDPLLFCGTVWRTSNLRACAWLCVRGMISQFAAFITAHVSGAFGHTTVHRGLTTRETEEDTWVRLWTSQMSTALVWLSSTCCLKRQLYIFPVQYNIWALTHPTHTHSPGTIKRFTSPPRVLWSWTHPLWFSGIGAVLGLAEPTGGCYLPLHVHAGGAGKGCLKDWLVLAHHR